MNRFDIATQKQEKQRARKERLIAKALNTDYGREELRRSIIRGMKNLSATNSKKGILARCILDIGILGPEPKEWETNPHKWSFQSQMNTTSYEE